MNKDVTINTHLPLFMKSKKVMDIYTNKDCTEMSKIGHIIYNDSKDDIDEFIRNIIKFAVGEERYDSIKIVTIDEALIYEDFRDKRCGRTALMNLCDQYDADNTVIFVSSYIHDTWYRGISEDIKLVMKEALIPFMEDSAFQCVTTEVIALGLYSDELITDTLKRTSGDFFIFENNCGIDIIDFLNEYKDKIEQKCEE